MAAVISTSAIAARVEYIDPKLNFAIVDQGRIHGVAPGANICILDDKKFITSCSGVVLVNRTKAAIRLPAEEMRRIQLGSEISIKEIFLKDDAAPGVSSQGLPVFRPARVKTSSLPSTISAAASEKESELSVGYEGPPPQPSYVESRSESTSESLSGPVVEQNAQDPYADIDRLGDIVKLPDSKRDLTNLTWKELRERIVFRAFTVETQIIFPLSQAAGYRAPSFATIPADNPARTTMWETRDVKKTATSGFSLQLNFMNPKEINYNFGWRYYPKVAVSYDSNLDERFPRILSHSKTAAESMGLWAQRIWRFKQYDFLFTDLGLGADFNVSDVSFKSNYDSSDADSDPLASGLIANARSRMSSLSFRASAAQVMKIFRFNLSLALSVYKPVFIANSSFEANAKVPAGGTISSDEIEDMKTAINHTHKNFAADLHLGIGSQF